MDEYMSVRKDRYKAITEQCVRLGGQIEKMEAERDRLQNAYDMEREYHAGCDKIRAACLGYRGALEEITTAIWVTTDIVAACEAIDEIVKIAKQGLRRKLPTDSMDRLIARKNELLEENEKLRESMLRAKKILAQIDEAECSIDVWAKVLQADEWLDDALGGE